MNLIEFTIFNLCLEVDFVVLLRLPLQSVAQCLIWKKKKSEVCGCERKKTKNAIEVEEEHIFCPFFFSFLRQLTAEVFLGS